MAKSETHAASPDTQAHEIGGPMAWWVWTLSVVFVVYLFSFQTGYAIVNNNVQTDVGLSIAQVGTIAAVYTWAFAICQFFGGALLDRLGARAVLPISIALVTLGIFIFANAKSYEMLLLSQVVIALGSCTGFVGAGYIGGQWFGMAKFSFMFGLVQVMAALTSAFSQNLIDVALSSMTWRTLFNYSAVFGVLLFILGAIYIRNPTPVVSKSSAGIGEFFISVIGQLADVAKIQHVWIASLVGALTFGAMLALGVVWMPKLLQVHGLIRKLSVLGRIVAVAWSRSRQRPDPALVRCHSGSKDANDRRGCSAADRYLDHAQLSAWNDCSDGSLFHFRLRQRDTHARIQQCS